MIQNGAYVGVHVTRIQKHHVYVGAGIEFPPTIAPQRDHGATLGALADAGGAGGRASSKVRRRSATAVSAPCETPGAAVTDPQWKRRVNARKRSVMLWLPAGNASAAPPPGAG